MRGKYRPHHILEVVLLFIALAGFSASNSKANENSKYFDAVREFADNVLKYGRDTYCPKHTPLFVDGPLPDVVALLVFDRIRPIASMYAAYHSFYEHIF